MTTWILPLGLLCGCASTPPITQKVPTGEHEVVGQPAPEDRAVISASDQQIFDVEHGIAPSSGPASAPAESSSTSPSSPSSAPPSSSTPSSTAPSPGAP